MRVAFLIGSVTLAFLFITYNVYTLQVEKGDLYFNKAQAQRLSDGRLLPQRGSIYITDKNGSDIPAAINKEYPVIYAVPIEVSDPQETSRRLAEVLPVDVNAMITSLSKEKDQYEVIVSKATESQVEKIRAAAIPGIYIANEKFRYYPFESLASQVLGYVSNTDPEKLAEGRYGLESKFNESLTGVPGGLDDEKREIPPTHGESLRTTIDQHIQGRAEEILEQLVSDFSPTGGTIIVQETKTGKILAMANAPSFDPNDYGKYPLETFVNPAVQHTYEPGSIIKVITMAAGIDSGAITPQTGYNDTGSVTLDGWTIRNWDLKAHGWITMTNVLEESVNTGSIFAAQKMGYDVFYQYLLRFGFKEPTGIDLPGEVSGNLTQLATHRRAAKLGTASYGHGFSVTPIRLISAISAIGNKGVMRTPYITELGANEETNRILSESTAKQVTDMMVSAVTKAKVARIPHYRVAGKTGTAFVPEAGGYSDRVINTYVGFAPADNAEITVLVKLNEPKGSPLAGQTVVPAFKQMMEFSLNYLNIPPDEVGS